MSKIVCLTPTGDRPESLALSRKYFERAKALCLDTVEWVVVDDGMNAFNPGGCKYLRRTPDGPNSLGRNLKYGLTNGALDCEFLLIWEDDDWYAPTRIINQVKQLNRWPMHGYSKTIYYNLRAKGAFQHDNFLHSSLFETAMRKEAAQTFDALIDQNINEPFLDLLLWKRIKGGLTPHAGEAIGIKGAKGRLGLGSGHRDTLLNYTKANLEDYIGGDVKNYERAVSVLEVGSKDVTCTE